MPDITFYCTLNETHWSHHPTAPGSHACIAPTYGRKSQLTNRVSVPRGTQVILDSGAFSDRTRRLTFEQALFRQVAHAYRFGYVRQVTHVASYDYLIPTKQLTGSIPPGGTELAVHATIAAATYLDGQRNAIDGMFLHNVGLILTAQGSTPEQYLRCVRAIVPLLRDGDILGLGGFAATGLMPKQLLPPFKEVVRLVVPYLGLHNVRQVHLWGCCYTPALKELLSACSPYGIAVSVDSSGPQRKPYLGQWGYGSWRDGLYKTPPILDSCRAVLGSGYTVPVCPPGTFCRGLERARHVEAVREWLAAFSEREAISKA